ncbi:MAG: hydroxyacid dehydrogenase [Planctomycetes bacterium]|nr:hydroxyacid dehydrogenase [Planctomycetota bacterium]
MKVLVADKLPEAALAALGEARFQVTADPSLKDDALVAKVTELQPEVLIVRSTKVPRAVLEAGPVALVIRAGAGVNNVDCAAASELGIYVANCPGKNAIAVAELTWGLILSLDRKIPDCVQDIRAGRWRKKHYGTAQGLYGRTLGLIGLGAIGRAVAERARGFGMPVVAWSRSLTPEAAEAQGLTYANSPHDVARQADVVSVHVALNDETRGMIDASFFAAMRPGAFFVNTSRGAVVDADALRAAVEGGLEAGLDVWSVQPSTSEAPFEDPLRTASGVYGTHHGGASTAQAQTAVALEAIRIAVAFRDEGVVPNCVNLAASAPSPSSLIVRHLDRVGVLAAVLGALKEADLNVQEMQNVLFSGEAAAACATIHVSGPPSAALLERLAGLEHVLDVQAK